jgi:hypothetical protein
MKRFIFGLVVVFTLLASPSAAQSLTSPDHPVSGSFSGTGTLSGNPCALYHQTATATGDLVPLGVSQVSLDFCVGNVPDGLHYPVTSGTFTIAALDGTVSGSMSGFVQPGVPVDDGYPFQLVLTAAGGTGRYTESTGTIILDGSFGLAAQTLHGTASGTLRFGSTTKSDCKHGGWRTISNPQGQPYTNQGACVSSVKSR